MNSSLSNTLSQSQSMMEHATHYGMASVKDAATEIGKQMEGSKRRMSAALRKKFAGKHLTKIEQVTAAIKVCMTCTLPSLAIVTLSLFLSIQSLLLYLRYTISPPITLPSFPFFVFVSHTLQHSPIRFPNSRSSEESHWPEKCVRQVSTQPT